MRTRWFGIVSVFAVSLALAACGGDGTNGLAGPQTPAAVPTISIGECQTDQGAQQPSAPKGEDWRTQLRRAGVLAVGSDNAYPPFEEIKPGAKEPEGFDVDLYKEVARRMGIEARSTTTDFDGLFTQSVPQGRFDVGVSAITIKEDRKQTVDFTIPYFQADLSLAINVDRTPDIRTIDDLSGQTLGAQKGTTGEDCAKFLVEQRKAKDVRSYGDAGQAFQDLIAGRVAAIVNDAPASQGFVDKNASVLKVVQIISTREQYGFAISKDKPDLREEINKHLRALMEDGTYERIYEKWFKTKPPFDVPLS